MVQFLLWAGSPRGRWPPRTRQEWRWLPESNTFYWIHTRPSFLSSTTLSFSSFLRKTHTANELEPCDEGGHWQTVLCVKGVPRLNRGERLEWLSVRWEIIAEPLCIIKKIMDDAAATTWSDSARKLQLQGWFFFYGKPVAPGNKLEFLHNGALITNPLNRNNLQYNRPRGAVSFPDTTPGQINSMKFVSLWQEN